MTQEDFWTGIGVLVSTILSGLFWLWDIGILQTLFTFLAGALVTFFVQSKLQDRAEKKKRRVEHIEKFFIPVFLKIENIKENLLLNLQNEGISSWHELIKQPQMFVLKSEFRHELRDFFEKTQKIVENLDAIKRVAGTIIYDNFEEHFFPLLLKDERFPLEEEVKKKIQKPAKLDGVGFQLIRKNPHTTVFAPIRECAILGHDPIQFLKKRHKTFEIDKLCLLTEANYLIGGSYKNAKPMIHITEEDKLVKDFWRRIIREVQKDTNVHQFNIMREELIPIADDLLGRFKKHIEKYIPIEGSL